MPHLNTSIDMNAVLQSHHECVGRDIGSIDQWLLHLIKRCSTPQCSIPVILSFRSPWLFHLEYISAGRHVMPKAVADRCWLACPLRQKTLHQSQNSEVPGHFPGILHLLHQYLMYDLDFLRCLVSRDQEPALIRGRPAVFYQFS